MVKNIFDICSNTRSFHTYIVCTCLECYSCETVFDNVRTSSCHD